MAIDAPAPPRIRGLVCRNCGTPEALGPSYVCAACFGPLEVAYDLDQVRAQVTPADIADAAAGHLALPRAAPPRRRARARAEGREHAADRGVAPRRRRSGSTACCSRTTPATRRSRSRTAPWPSPPRGSPASGSRRWAARAPATSPAPPPPRPPPSASRPSCSSRPTSSPPRSSTRSRTAPRSSAIDGTYDDVNRLCLEVADELPWGLVNVNLRPFYAEGSKTLGYEIAEDLGWRLPTSSSPRSRRAR